MSKSAYMWLGLGLALASAGAAAQTVNRIPKYQTSTTFSDSPISVSGSNVGIGTTGPGAQLDVRDGSGIAIQASHATLKFSDIAGTMLLQMDNKGNLQVTDGSGNPRVFFPNGGSVGIGTTAPLSALTLAGTNGSNPNTGPQIDYNGQNISFENLAVSKAIGQIKMVQPTGYYIDAGDMVFSTSAGPLSEKMRVTATGNVGIGTTNPLYKLSVNGTIQAKEVLVNTGWSDYVFDPNYRIRSLTEVAAFIKANHHLPDIPSEAEVKENGVSLGDMQSKLLAKIEELTLQMIQLNDKNTALEKRVAQIDGHK